MSNPKEARKDDELHKILSNGYVSCDDRGKNHSQFDLHFIYVYEILNLVVHRKSNSYI
jgi:hypothetical protein